jgi:sulfite reductase (NADPH) flavoprotein alpha-component
MSKSLNPFSSEQQQIIASLLENASPEQLFWLGGYLSGLIQNKGLSTATASATLTTAVANSNSQLTVLYGTHTGHSEQIARQLERKAAEKGITVKVVSLNDYKVRNIEKEQNLALIVSTHGEGVPPLMAEALYEYVKSGKARLNKLNYSVLALGDRSYKLFCQTGTDFDEAFARLGGKPIVPLVKCDVEYEADVARWIDQLLGKFTGTAQGQAIIQPLSHPSLPKYSKQNPFFARVLDKRKITGRNSSKEVWHVELSLEGSGLSYEPGDTLGVFSNNPPELVQHIIDFTGLPANATITTRYDDVTLYEALYHHYEITVLNPKVLEDYAALTKNAKLKKLLKDETWVDTYLYGSDLLDLLKDFPATLTPHQLVTVLRYLPPRMYSISSSYVANPDEVHITVGKVDYEVRNRKRKGACSSYLSERLRDNEKIPIFIEKNINFRLPETADAPVIMIGAGTGIAPYRAFLQEFENTGRQNHSWLFFGERTFTDDFLYQVEWQKYLQKGILGKIDLAFSRDQQEKLYVQHKLKEKAEELYQWLNQGAHLYICGDRKRMFNDVQETLIEIISTHGGISTEKAKEYLKELQRLKRYQTDVY